MTTATPPVAFSPYHDTERHLKGAVAQTNFRLPLEKQFGKGAKLVVEYGKFSPVDFLVENWVREVLQHWCSPKNPEHRPAKFARNWRFKWPPRENRNRNRNRTGR